MEGRSQLEARTLDTRVARRGRCAESLVVLAFCVSICACGASSGQDHLVDAREALAAGAYEDAIAAANAGLEGNSDPVSMWGLEVVKLEALSRSGQADASMKQLEKLAAKNPDRVAAAEYAGTAQRLRTADQNAGAIQVLDLGHKRFPDDPVINKMIADSVDAGVDPAELDMLKSLGYID